jgi:protein TonB
MTTALPRMKAVTAATRAGGPGLRAIAAAAALHAGLLGVVGLLGPWQGATAPEAVVATVSLAFGNPEPAMEPIEPTSPESESALPAEEPAEASAVEPVPLQALAPDTPPQPQPELPTVVARALERPAAPATPTRSAREATAAPPARPQGPAPPTVPPSAAATGVGQPASGPPPQAYVAGLLAHLKRRHEYPSAARARREEGLVMLRLEIAADGSLRSCVIEQSSGSQILDAAALALARGAAPYPPPPASAVLHPFRVPVGYRLAR